jgi:hypothetical protein
MSICDVVVMPMVNRQRICLRIQAGMAELALDDVPALVEALLRNVVLVRRAVPRRAEDGASAQGTAPLTPAVTKRQMLLALLAVYARSGRALPANAMIAAQCGYANVRTMEETLRLMRRAGCRFEFYNQGAKRFVRRVSKRRRVAA